MCYAHLSKIKMSLKKLFGLESFPLKDYELIEKIVEAKRNHTKVLEFKNKCGKVIRIKVNDIYPEGVMHGNYRMYK